MATATTATATATTLQVIEAMTAADTGADLAGEPVADAIIAGQI